MHDDHIREQFATWAQPLRETRPSGLPFIRQRARRRLVRRTAVSGLAAAAVVAAIALSGFHRAGHVPAAPATARNLPPYAVLLEHGGATASVLDMVTGKSLGQVTPPGPGSEFGWVAAASDDRTFVLTDDSPSLVIQFYRLRLTASGKPGRLVQLKVPSRHRSEVYGMALTADASKLAVAWQNDPAGPVTGHLSVTTLATGATRTWSSAAGGATTVSWAGDRTVAFNWTDAIDDQARSGVRLLDTAAPGASLLATRLILPAATGAPAYYSPGNPVITQDGSTVLALRSAADTSAVVGYSARTGKLQTVLTPALPSAGNPLSYCGILWSGPSGRHLVVQCGAVQASSEDNRYGRIRLPRLIPASPVGTANTFAW